MPPEAVLLSKIIEDGVATGKLEMDSKGYTKFIPNDDELREIEQYLGQELTRTLDDYQPLFQEAVENVKCYRHVKVMLETGKAVLPAPIARIPADYIIASNFTAIMNPRPVFSLDPYYPGKFPVMVPVPEGSPFAPAGTPAQPHKDAEEIARNLEKGVEFLIRELLDFEAKLHKAIRGAVIGCPFWWKIRAEPKGRDVMGPKAKGIFIDPNVKYMYRQEGEIVHLDLVPFFNFIRPVDFAEDELDDAPWCAERTPQEPTAIIRGFYSKDCFLLKNLLDAQNLSKLVSNVHNPYQEAVAAITQQKVKSNPRQICDVWHVPFYRDALYTDPETGDKAIRRLNLVGDYHLGAKRLLNCYLNPYEHQSRAYVFYDQMEEGDSTVKILRWHQDVATHLMQAQIKNAFIANNMNTWSNEDSDAADFFAIHKTIEPGEHLTVPGKFEEDWGVMSLGTNHESLLPTWQAVVAEAKACSKVSGVMAGENLPGRTPAQTMEQAIQQGSQENLLFLRRQSRHLSRVLRLYLETRRQFQPMGESLPMFDPINKQMTEIPFRLPVGEGLNNFRIALTAADQALAQERNVERIAMWKNIVMQDGEFVAKIAAAMVDAKATPALLAMFEKMISRDQKLLSRIVQLNDTDEDEFDLTAEIDAILKEREDMQRQLAANPPPPPQSPPPKINISLKADLPPDQEAALAQNMGIANANQAAQPTGNVSGPQGTPNQGGPVGVGVQPNVAPNPGPPSAGGVPPAQQIQR